MARTFLSVVALALTAMLFAGRVAHASDDDYVTRRVEGMLLGAAIGDALGGPYEFQTSEHIRAAGLPHREWGRGDRLTPEGIAELNATLDIHPYGGTRPDPEPYGPWLTMAPAGTITDDTRFKIMLIRALREAKGAAIGPEDIARAILAFREQPPVAGVPKLEALYDEGLRQFAFTARWVLGERDRAKALPPERLWGGIATVCGQMMFPPLAARYPGEPAKAYEATYALDFLDNGPGKDLNASIIAGLATALATPLDEANPEAAWDAIRYAMVTTDPYRYAEVPWLERPVTRWLRIAHDAATEADGHPARLFNILERDLNATTYWEAHVPLTAAFAVLECVDYHPIAAINLLRDFGHDTDSNLQLLGAFLGALHGPDIFPETARRLVAERLQADYGEDVGEWVALLAASHK